MAENTVEQIERLWKSYELGYDYDPNAEEYPQEKITELFTIEQNGDYSGHWTEEFEFNNEKFRIYIYTADDQPTQDSRKYEGWLNVILSENQLNEEQKKIVLQQCGIDEDQLNPMDINDISSANIFNVAGDDYDMLWKELRKGIQIILDNFKHMMELPQNNMGYDGWYCVYNF